eukprot:scaffold294195_cov18-Tisochrysis_lutea.AAC.1
MVVTRGKASSWALAPAKSMKCETGQQTGRAVQPGKPDYGHGQDSRHLNRVTQTRPKTWPRTIRRKPPGKSLVEFLYITQISPVLPVYHCTDEAKQQCTSQLVCMQPNAYCLFLIPHWCASQGWSSRLIGLSRGEIRGPREACNCPGEVLSPPTFHLHASMKARSMT